MDLGLLVAHCKVRAVAEQKTLRQFLCGQDATAADLDSGHVLTDSGAEESLKILLHPIRSVHRGRVTRYISPQVVRRPLRPQMPLPRSLLLDLDPQMQQERDDDDDELSDDS